MDDFIFGEIKKYIGDVLNSNNISSNTISWKYGYI